jgi:hypothetical protein
MMRTVALQKQESQVEFERSYKLRTFSPSRTYALPVHSDSVHPKSTRHRLYSF